MVVLLRRCPRVDTNDLDIGKLGEESNGYGGNEVGRTLGYKWSLPLGSASILFNDCNHHVIGDNPDVQLAGRIWLLSCSHMSRIANAEGRTEIGGQIRDRVFRLPNKNRNVHPVRLRKP